MSGLDLGDQLGHYELLSELPGYGKWRVLEQQSGSDEWLLTRGPAALHPERAPEAFEQALKTLSYINHPGLIKPIQFFLYEGDLYWVSPLPSSTRVTDYLQLHAPPLPKLVAWLADLCSLLEECHQAPQPLFWGRSSLSDLRVHDGRIQLVGLELNGDGVLQFHTPEGLGARADVLAVASLLGELLRRGSGMAREAYRRNSALRKLMVAATSQEPARRPASLSSLKVQLEKIPRTKPPASLKIGRFTLVLEGYRLYAVPLSMAGLVLCCLLALGLAQPPGVAPRHLPRTRRARPQPKAPPAARVILEPNPPVPPTTRPPGSS